MTVFFKIMDIPFPAEEQSVDKDRFSTNRFSETRECPLVIVIGEQMTLRVRPSSDL